MQRKEPLKEILASTKALWDDPGTRPSVRSNFHRMLKCRTEALGAEIYASDTEQKLVYHTCKSRACPSCGHRATILWQRNMWASLPEVPFTGVVFTMPDVLWPIFRENRRLLDDLPVLGATVLKEWAKYQYQAQIMILVVRHTFGRHLNFNSHLHILASAVGLRHGDGEMVKGIRFEWHALMKMWRFALIAYLRAALRKGLLKSLRTPEYLRSLFTKEYERGWIIDIQPYTSKEHFLRYAGRYVRRPPIAQYRFVEHSKDQIRFRTQDHQLKKEVITQYSPEEFVRLLGEHVPDYYKHAVRYFGLLAPRSKGHTSGAIFAALNQDQRPRPRHLSWAYSIEREFGVNPLLDSKGAVMRLVGRKQPSV